MADYIILIKWMSILDNKACPLLCRLTCAISRKSCWISVYWPIPAIALRISNDRSRSSLGYSGINRPEYGLSSRQFKLICILLSALEQFKTTESLHSLQDSWRWNPRGGQVQFPYLSKRHWVLREPARQSSPSSLQLYFLPLGLYWPQF